MSKITMPLELYSFGPIHHSAAKFFFVSRRLDGDASRPTVRRLATSDIDEADDRKTFVVSPSAFLMLVEQRLTVRFRVLNSTVGACSLYSHRPSPPDGGLYSKEFSSW